MKYFLIIILLTAKSITLFGSIVCDTTIDYSIKVNNYNIFYKGMNNRIILKALSVPLQNIKLISNMGVLSGSDSLYYLKTDYLAPILIKIIYIDNSKNEKIIGTINFLVKEQNEYIPILAGKATGSISKADIFKNPIINIIRNDTILDFKIKSFSISTKLKIDSICLFKRVNINSNGLNEKALKLISHAIYGQAFFLEKIIAKNKNNEQIDIPPLIFQIKL